MRDDTKTAPPGYGGGAAEAAGEADAALGFNPLVGTTGVEVIRAFQQVAAETITHPWSGIEQYADFVGAITRAWLGQSNLAPQTGDKRFTDPVWKSNPFYRAWLQTYLAWGDALYRFADSAGLGRQDAQRARFALSLLVDASAPTNAWLGNPAAIKKFFETGGASAVRGLTHLVEDIARNGGMPSQVNKDAFRVGDNLAVTPGAVVFRNEVLEVIQYEPTTEMVYRRPLLMVPPQINKYYILDLAPGRSLIEYLVGNGIQTFMLSWRNPTPAERDWRLETYLRAILEAIHAVRDISGSPDINMAATCSGGITTALLLGHMAAAGERLVNALTLHVTILDTGGESQVGLVATKETLELARLASRLKGVLEGQELARVFAWLRPNDLVWNYWVNNYLLGEDPPAFDILYWNNDTTNLPARLHGEFLDMFAGNPLTKRGTLKLLGTPIDLSKIEIDTYVLAGLTDHIAPWQACYASTQLLGGHCEFVLNSSGHVQSIVNPPGNPRAKFFRNTQVTADPDAWLAGAQQQAGSWWEHWRDWLGERSGERTKAPTQLGSPQHPAGEQAPGSYVLS